METEAKEAAILNLLGIYRLAERIPAASIDAMLAGVAPYSVDVVQRACINFRDGLVPGRNAAYPPEAPELIAEVRRLDALTLPDRPLQGVTEVDYGIRIRTGHLSTAEVDYVMDRKGVFPDGRSMAFLSGAELKAEVAVALKALPSPEPKSMADIVPHLKRFADA